MAGSSTTGSGWGAGATLTVTVTPPSGTNCTGEGYLYFSGSPTVTVDSSTGTGVSPQVSASLSNGGPCDAAEPNELKIAFVNADYFVSSSTATVTITVSGIRYDVGATASAVGEGSVLVSASFAVTGSSAPAAVGTSQASNAVIGTSESGGSTQPAGGTSSPAGGTPIAIKANTPPVTLVEGTHDAPISPVEILGSATTPVPAGYVCVTVVSGSFDAASDPTVATTSGNGEAGPATYVDSAATDAETVEFQVQRASTTPGGYSLSRLAVNAPTRTGPVVVEVTLGKIPTCAQDVVPGGSATAYSVVATPVTRIYGPTADATAAAELEHQFDAQATACPGRPGARPVVLATDGRFPDALASAYLASSLDTGELLTPASSLSTVTADAIRTEGITQVYIVGGSLAVSTTVAQRLESTLAYECGGSSPLTSGGPVHIEVTRIAGSTQYDTAEWIAEYPPTEDVGSLDVVGAYTGTNATGGTGRYNDTAGKGSPAPEAALALPTAILATGTTFQDAESASVLSYADRLPILLTSPTSLVAQASSAISDLGIRQVVVMGGPLAVSDSVVSSLESLGLAVLRIAGKSASDTSVQLANFEEAPSADHLGAGWSGSGGVTVARGDFFTDGLAGAVVAAGGGPSHTAAPEPLLLCTGPSTVGEYLSEFLTVAGRTGVDGDAADRVTSLTILGGPAAVAPSAVSTMVGDL